MKTYKKMLTSCAALAAGTSLFFISGCNIKNGSFDPNVVTEVLGGGGATAMSIEEITNICTGGSDLQSFGDILYQIYEATDDITCTSTAYAGENCTGAVNGSLVLTPGLINVLNVLQLTFTINQLVESKGVIITCQENA